MIMNIHSCKLRQINHSIINGRNWVVFNLIGSAWKSLHRKMIVYIPLPTRTNIYGQYWTTTYHASMLIIQAMQPINTITHLNEKSHHTQNKINTSLTTIHQIKKTSYMNPIMNTQFALCIILAFSFCGMITINPFLFLSKFNMLWFPYIWCMTC